MTEVFLKITVIMLLLVLVYRLEDRECGYVVPIFENFKWDLMAAYKLFLSYFLLLFFVHKFLLTVLPLRELPLSQTSKAAIITIPLELSFFLLFIAIIKRPFQIQWNSFGINLKSITHKVTPILLFTSLLFIIYIYMMGINNTIVMQLSSIKIILIIIVIVLNSFIEELLFRGIMWSAFIKKMNTPIAALVTSICWGLWHYDTPLIGSCSIIFIGLFLSWSYFKSRTILVPMAIHTSYNLILILIIK
ncbi:MAG: type II CAAX endopeptidase family protein [Smithella sp.]